MPLAAPPHWHDFPELTGRTLGGACDVTVSGPDLTKNVRVTPRGTTLALVLISGAACSSHLTANQQGVQALAALKPPTGFTEDSSSQPTNPAACHASASTRCFSTTLPIGAALRELLPVLGSKATNDCPGTPHGHLPCTVYGAIGPTSAAAMITRVGGGYEASIELLET